MLVLSFFALLAFSGKTWATDDNENSTPTAWWIYHGQSYSSIQNTIKTKNARIVDISADSPNAFTVTYVSNTGTYAKAWWWYVGIDAPTLTTVISQNKARLISLSAYDIGGGNIRFAVAMIANTGADSKAWWYYYGQSPSQITSLTSTNNARLTSLQSYTDNGQTVYSVIMISNTGADAKGWWWWYNVPPQTIANNVNANDARVLQLTPAGNGTFNAVLESCSSGCPGWWWYYGQTGQQVLSDAQNDGARVIAAESYPGCGASNGCMAITMISNTPPDITACDNNGCISEAKLEANICNTLANKVVGYSCAVGGLAPSYGGLARTSTNPPVTSMVPSLVTNIASVSKTMTSVAVLQLLTKNKITIDSKISPYLYTDWSQGLNINALTFRELLTHTSGFGQLPNNACGNGLDYFSLKAIIAGGVSSSNIGKPQYGNCNFALMRELMPALMGQPLNSIPDGSQRAQKSASHYVTYMNAHVFKPVGIPPRQCKPPAGTGDILSYPFPAGSTSGIDWGDWTLLCGGGGWVLSGNDIFNVVNDLANGKALLTNAEKQQMFSDCLGWDCAVRNDCPTPYVCKNGDLTNGNGINIWTYAGIVKCNVPVVVVVNSPLPAPYQPGEDIIGLVKDALAGAVVPGTGAACPL
jgi:hypothetical protein